MSTMVHLQPQFKVGTKAGKDGTVAEQIDGHRCKEKKQPGRYSDGDGLYLYVSADLNKSWVFRWVREGKRREMGLGEAT